MIRICNLYQNTKPRLLARACIFKFMPRKTEAAMIYGLVIFRRFLNKNSSYASLYVSTSGAIFIASS